MELSSAAGTEWAARRHEHEASKQQDQYTWFRYGHQACTGGVELDEQSAATAVENAKLEVQSLDILPSQAAVQHNRLAAGANLVQVEQLLHLAQIVCQFGIWAALYTIFACESDRATRHTPKSSRSPLR